jgi:hypothetical protein
MVRSRSGAGEDFDGYSYGRVMVFDDETSLTCADYGYDYSLSPTAVILVKYFEYQGKEFYDVKMVVDDDIYDME